MAAFERTSAGTLDSGALLSFAWVLRKLDCVFGTCVWAAQEVWDDQIQEGRVKKIHFLPRFPNDGIHVLRIHWWVNHAAHALLSNPSSWLPCCGQNCGRTLETSKLDPSDFILEAVGRATIHNSS